MFSYYLGKEGTKIVEIEIYLVEKTEMER